MPNMEKFKKMYGNVLWTGKPNSFLGMPLNFTRYILTDEKLVVRKGFLNIQEDKIELYRMVDMSMKLPITQRIFKCGTINIISKDVSLPHCELKQVRNPYILFNLIEDSIKSEKKTYGVLGRDMYGAAASLHTCETNDSGDHLETDIPEIDLDTQDDNH